MKPTWDILQPEPRRVAAVRRALQCGPWLAALLVNRRLERPESVARFLQGRLGDLRSPFTLAGMESAVSRIHRALVNREPILVFGDYDADGITAAVLLTEFLSAAGARVRCHIPRRLEDGYGLHPGQVHRLAAESGMGLIITADCGTSDGEAVATARTAGIDVIVTDHHEVTASPPPAAAFINPKRPDCRSGLDHLAGTGVAYYLLIGLRKHLRDRQYWAGGSEPNLKRYLDLVALGTVADMVPLIAENRLFVRDGLAEINRSPRPGIQALKTVGRLGRRPADASDIAFRLAPRINAAGRMGDPSLAMRLLTARDSAAAGRMAAELDQINLQRRESEKALVDQARKRIESCQELLESRALVLWDTEWHEGVLGIAASRLVQRYWRPVVLIAERDGMGRGSARSIPGFDLLAGLVSCRHHLETCGGHEMAAGLRIRAECLPAFREELSAIVAAQTPPAALAPRLQIDGVLPLDQVSESLMQEIECLEPYGVGNPEPLFAARNVTVTSSRIVGGCHRSMRLAQGGAGGGAIPAIHFGIDPATPAPAGYSAVAYRLRRRRWNGENSLQLVVEDVR